MKRIAVVVFAGAVLLTACQSAAEVLTEQIAEQVEGVDDVKIDTETGEIRIETDEGSISIGSGTVPDGFPVSLPDGGDVAAVFTSPEGSSVTLTYAIDRYDDLVQYYSDWTAGQPGEWNKSSSTFESNGQTVRSSSWIGSTDNEGVSINVVDCFGLDTDSDGYNAVCVNVIAD